MFTYISMLVMDWRTMMPSNSTMGGSRCLTVWMRFCTFKTATFGSVPGSKMIRIVASPALVPAETM